MRDERQDREYGKHREVLKKQDAERGPAVLGLELAALGEHLQDEGRGGQRQTEADDGGGLGLQAQQVARHTQQHGTQDNLCGAESENESPHDPQARRLQLETDDEEQQHDAELCDFRDVADVVDEAQAPRSDDEARRHVAEDRAEVQQSEQRYREYGGGEQDRGLGE